MILGVQQLRGKMGVSQQSLVPGNIEIMWACGIVKLLGHRQGVGGGVTWLGIELTV